MKKTQKLIDAILESIKLGVSQVEACKANDIDYVTWYLWQKADEELKAKVHAILDSRVIVIEDVYYKRLLMGTASPAEYIFFFKNRAPERWRDVQHYKGEGFETKIVVNNIKQIIEQAQKENATNNRIQESIPSSGSLAQ